MAMIALGVRRKLLTFSGLALGFLAMLLSLISAALLAMCFMVDREGAGFGRIIHGAGYLDKPSLPDRICFPRGYCDCSRLQSVQKKSQS